MKRSWLLLLALMVPLAAQADKELDRVFACMSANAPPTVRVQQIELTSTDRSGGKRTLKGRLFAKGEKTAGGERQRILLKVDEPADFAGASYLVRQGENYLQDGMYVYLPSVRRVRRVSGTFADGSLLGTNFSYNDFRMLQLAFIDAEALLEDPETIENRPTHVISFTPSPEAQSRYSLIRLWVDQKTCLPLKSEFREGLDLIKELTVPVTALQQSGNRWYASEARMRDVTDGSSSVMRIVGTALGASIPGSYFDPGSFYVGK